MRSYIVGGWVRDQLLGRATPDGDRDWVVVGASPEALTALGYRPVGRDFPVFIHPQSGEEYALARTERKTAPGYRGFVVHAAPDVTLEQDLQRRDLTINAIAMDESGTLVDPCQGQADLRQRILRHVGPAFVEDPVRILRLARFAARLADFTIAPETLALCRAMVEAGEVDALVPERAWREIARGLMEDHPERLVQVLHDTGALQRLAPGLDAMPERQEALQRAAAAAAPLASRFAVLVAALAEPGWEALQAHVRADADSLQVARLLRDLRGALAGPATAAGVLDLLERADALRRPQRFEELLLAAAALDPATDAVRWRRLREAAAGVAAGPIAASVGPDALAIAAAVRAARVAAIAAASA